MRLLRPLLLSLCAVAAALLVGEGSYRGLRALQEVPYRAEKTRADLREILSSARDAVPQTGALDGAEQQPGAPAATESAAPDETPAGVEGPEEAARRAGFAEDLRLHPFLGFTAAGFDLRLVQQLAEPRQPTTKRRIVVLGGSVAAIFSNHGVPALSFLAPFAPRGLVAMNLAQGGYKQPQQVISLAYLFALGVRPDLVLNLDGFNEVALGNSNQRLGVSPLHPSVSHWMALAREGLGDSATLELAAEVWSLGRDLQHRVQRSLDLDLARSAVLGTVALERARAAQAQLRRRTGDLVTALARRGVPEHLRGPAVESGAEMEAIGRSWQECSRSLRAMCESRGIPYVHVLQPTLLDPGSKPVTEEELASGQMFPEWKDGVERGYPLLRELGGELAAEGLLFFDASRAFADETATLYYDACHFGREGNRLLAKAIAAHLEELRQSGRLVLDD
jgi:hypothetical protein